MSIQQSYTSDGPVSSDPTICHYCHKAPAGHPVEECEGIKRATPEPLDKWHPDEQTVRVMVNGIVMPAIAVLLSEILEAIEASIPNKDQNRAVKKIVRNSFDRAYMDILRESHPGQQFAFGPGYAIEPATDKYHAVVNTYPE